MEEVVNPPITEKEKLLVKILVKLYSKERLENEMDECLDEADNYSEIVTGAAKLIGVEKYKISRLGVQYLNYAIEHYDKIKEGNFPEKIERIVQANFYGDTTESVVMTYYQKAVTDVLHSKLEHYERHVFKNFYEYDPSTVDTDYGDNDFISFKPDEKATDFNELSVVKTVIE